MRPRRNFRPQRGKRTPEGGKGFTERKGEDGSEGRAGYHPRSFRPDRSFSGRSRDNNEPSGKSARGRFRPQESERRERRRPGSFRKSATGNTFPKRRRTADPGDNPHSRGFRPYDRREKRSPGYFERRRAKDSFSQSRDKTEERSGRSHTPGGFGTRPDSGDGGKRGFFEKRRTRGGRPHSPVRHDEKKRKPTQSPLIDSSGLVRLNKFIANSGVCSRREADNLISMALITVNGVTITEMGYKVKPGDEVRYENRILRAEKPVYVLLNKPKGYITTTEDPQERKTVMALVAKAARERIYPVGRLDRNTTGLLLLTNDGDLAEKLSHPSYEVKKIYKAELDKPITRTDFDRVLEGVHLEEGKARVDDFAVISDDRKTVGLEIHIGWNRVVRRIFESLGYQVVKLDRSVYAGLDKKDLARGQWRYLRPDEVLRLKHFSN